MELAKVRGAAQPHALSSSIVPSLCRNLLIFSIDIATNAERLRSLTDHTIACICAMSVGLEGMLDDIHEHLHISRDENTYTLGKDRPTLCSRSVRARDLTQSRGCRGNAATQ